jgi:hypothetical protein
VIITKPISIVADEVEAVINTAVPSSPNPAAIVISAGGGAIVSLRGLTIDMRGTDNEGISFLSGKALHVQNSVIRKDLLGIRFAPKSGTSELHVADTAVEGSGAVNLMIERTALLNNATGILASVGATVRVGNSTLTGNNIATNGSSIFSYGTNKIDGNGTNTMPSIIPLK